ncbi:unnamed protein product, partial [marine sediment metagenome]
MFPEEDPPPKEIPDHILLISAVSKHGLNGERPQNYPKAIGIAKKMLEEADFSWW